MREIKFRGKRIDNGEWVYGYLANGGLISAGAIQIGIESPNSRETAKMKAVIQAYQVDPETVGQYTGLRDKNGKEIYEGDIVVFHLDNPSESDREIKPAIGVVEYREDGFAVREIQTGAYIHKFDDQEWEEDLEFYNWAGQNFAWKELEVIGNIYDNPELLED